MGKPDAPKPSAPPPIAGDHGTTKPFPRFRLRALLIAVAVAAVLLGASIEAACLWRQSGAYRDRAAYHRAQLRIRANLPYFNDQQYSEDFEAMLRRRGWHEAMADKYERAAAQPWIAVDPDSPAPE